MWRSSLPPSSRSSFASTDMTSLNYKKIILSLIILMAVFVLVLPMWSHKVVFSAVSTGKFEGQTSTAGSVESLKIDAVEPIDDVNVEVSQKNDESHLKVNNQQVPIPASGTINKTLQDETGATQLNVSIDSHSTGTNSTNSSMNIQLNSSSETESTISSE